MDSKLVLEMIFNIIGGLGIFLFGMKSISEGMQAVAGEKLRKLIHAITNNRFTACGVGTLVTAIIQSSSITTVIVVGMVNAGIMTLTQAIGVIFGANIGTTITAWILVIKIGKYGLPILGISAIIYLFSKNERLRYTALTFLGLGMIFFGLELMKDGFAPLREMEQFRQWFSHFAPTSYPGIIKCVLVGSILTAIVQSSSATVGITMGLAFNGVIDYPTAAALVLGQNIGTTITAWLASLGATTNAKRASYAHIFFNVVGVIWITFVFEAYIKGVQHFILWFKGHEVAASVIENGQVTYPYVMGAIAITHTIFNIVNTIVFLPFVRLMANALIHLVPERRKVERPRLTALDIRLLDAPAIGIEQSQQEIFKMGKTSIEMMVTLKDILQSGSQIDTTKKDSIFQQEKNMDLIQKEVVEFVSHIITGSIPHDVAEQGREQLRIADEYESISDYITNILKLDLKLHNAGESITAEGINALLNLHDKVADYILLLNNAVKSGLKEDAVEVEKKGFAITELMKKYRSEHLARVEKGQASPLKSLMYTDMLNSYRRIKDHGLNIAEVLAGEK
ncbi:MAG: Na/Pi cotransporter family protein [Sedimentisphaerales bacterium]|nr:Na/Pi cotransporter family protein [Sedimentisphaerales bacterium]